MEQFCRKGLNDQGDWDCQRWAQSQGKGDYAAQCDHSVCGCLNYDEYAKIIELLAEEQKEVTIHLPRKIIAHMSTAPHITLLVKGHDAWCAKGQHVRDIAPNNASDPARKTLYIHLVDINMSTLDIIHSLTFRGRDLPKIKRVEPFGPQSDYESAYLNSFPAQTLDEITQRWCPSETGGITATSFRIHFEKEVNMRDIHLEAVGLVLKDFDETMKETKKSSHLLITSEGLRMNGPQ